MSHKAANVALFESWVRKGLGRAVTFLTQNNGAKYGNSILQACLHNVTYDAQLEEGRGQYLWMLIEHSGDRNLFRNALLQTLTRLPRKTEEYDWSQIFHVAKQFAVEGDSAMRLAMYSAFDVLGFDTAGVSPATSLMSIDPLEGFVLAVNRFDASSSEDNWWMIGSLISDLEDLIGKQPAEEIIANATAADTSVANVIGAYRRHEQEQRQTNERVDSEILDLQALKDLPGDRSLAWKFRRWAHKATDEELSAATNDFLSDVNPEKVWGCLRLFVHRPFPGDVFRLLELSNSDHQRVRSAAVMALSRIKDPRVRTRALMLLQSARRFTEGIQLLESNYEAGDFRLFDDLFSRSPTQIELHGMGMSILPIVEKNAWPELERVLLSLYEDGPCSLCRSGFVRALIAIGRLPDYIRHEAQFDAEPDTRRAVLDIVNSLP